jgi:hypothetical protein
MNRTPPIAVRRQLAQEVGFGCPVNDCGSPYLMWHHFGPPWSVEEHHRSEGMVALCRDHHPEADAGAFTNEQLRDFKRIGRDRGSPLGARFNWMREELLAVIGGNFFLQVPIAIQIHDQPVVWFNRNQSNELLVNLMMPSKSGEPRMQMIDNFWITEGASEREIVCPPSGRLVSAKYPSGDELTIEFREFPSLEALDARYPIEPIELPDAMADQLKQAGMDAPERPTSHHDTVERFGVNFPIASVEITMEIAGTSLSFGPRETAINSNVISAGWIKGARVGIQIGKPSQIPGGTDPLKPA